MYDLYKLEKTANGTTFTMIARAGSVSSALALAPRGGSGRYHVWDDQGNKCATVKITLPENAVAEPLHYIVHANRISGLMAG